MLSTEVSDHAVENSVFFHRVCGLYTDFSDFLFTISPQAENVDFLRLSLGMSQPVSTGNSSVSESYQHSYTQFVDNIILFLVKPVEHGNRHYCHKYIKISFYVNTIIKTAVYELLVSF